jgi:hypothetical protein
MVNFLSGLEGEKPADKEIIPSDDGTGDHGIRITEIFYIKVEYIYIFYKLGISRSISSGILIMKDIEIPGTGKLIETYSRGLRFMADQDNSNTRVWNLKKRSGPPRTSNRVISRE